MIKNPKKPFCSVEQLHAVLNKLAKWRMLFAGWQLGTRPKEDPESQAVRDHREVTLLLRAEVSAMVALLIRSGVFTEQDWHDALHDEAVQLDKDLEKRFPGASTSEIGLSFDVSRTPEIQSWMKGWKP